MDVAFRQIFWISSIPFQKINITYNYNPLFFSSDISLVESGLHTLTTVFSRVHGVESWPLVHELVIYICTILDPKLEKEESTYKINLFLKIRHLFDTLY